MNITIAGENSLIIYFGKDVSPEISAKVQQAVHRLQNSLQGVIIDLVPSYASLLVIYDLFRTDLHTIRPQIRELLSGIDQVVASEGRLVELPVYYSLESGPDLEILSSQTSLSVEEIISLHQAQEYRVYAIGFAPGFAYLGEVDERIAAPRLTTPRKQVPKGAVGIADRQTAVYPSISPGGWNLIGLCPQRMFDPEVTPCMPVEVGDRVCFKGIDRQTFLSLGGTLS
ncbi:MAG: allophanate hydrolase [Porticoccaceae bacterium]|nr:MAG: allophanate hydrolase [Porticoccaceae bacterium]